MLTQKLLAVTQLGADWVLWLLIALSVVSVGVMLERAAFFLARRHRNVYIDLSSIPPRRLLSYFPRIEEIQDKVLFGSDWPGPGVPGIQEERDGSRELLLTKDLREKILVSNARKIWP